MRILAAIGIYLFLLLVQLNMASYAAENSVPESKYRVVLVHSKGSYANFTPATEFDQDFQTLGLADTKIPVDELAGKTLAGNDLVIVGSMLLRDASNESYWKNPDKLRLDLVGAQFKQYLATGGVLLLTDIIESSGSYTLTHISPELKLNVAQCETGLTGKFGPSAIVNMPHRLADYATNYNPFQICRRVGGKFPWGRFTSVKGWDVLIRNPAGQPVMLSRTVGKGTVIATTLCAGRGIDAGLLENLLFHAKATAGQKLSATNAMVKSNFFRTKARAPRGRLPFDGQGNIMVDGKPFFPFGFYKVEEKNYRLIKESGFNTIMGINPVGAAKHGLRGDIGCSWDLEIARTFTQQTQAQDNKASPAILAQVLSEEPGNLPVPPFFSNFMREQDDMVKSIAPDRPTYVLVNNPLEFPAFGTLGDLAVCDPYPFQKADSSALRPGRDIDTLRRLSGNPNYPVWAILQAHWNGDPQGATDLVKPTPDQLLAQTYVALAHRANGIFYFIFDQGNEPDVFSVTFIHRRDGSFDEPLWSALKQMAAEMKVLQPALLAPLPEQTVKVTSKRNAVQHLLRRSGGKFYLIAVNPESVSLDATIDFGSERRPSTIRNLFGGSPTVRTKNGFTFKFLPYQRAVFEFQTN